MAKKYSTSDDMYRELVDESEENWLYGLVAFAIVEEQRVEWAKHYADNNGRFPNSNETGNWYEQQPKSVLLRAKGTAEAALQTFSAEVLETVVDGYKKEIEDDIIVSEIKSANSFWPQFGVNFAAGFASAVLFAALLILVAFFVLNDSSPIQIGKQLKGGMEVIENGKK